MSYDAWKTTDPADADPYRDDDCPVCRVGAGYRCAPECDCADCVKALDSRERHDDDGANAMSGQCRAKRLRMCLDHVVEETTEYTLVECVGGLHKGSWILWSGPGACLAIGGEAWVRSKIPPDENPRAKDEDDGQTYGHPADHLAERRGR